MMTNAKIVLIEDEKNICSLIERILAPQGCQVVSCFTGRDGLELIRSRDKTRPFFLNLWYYLVHMPEMAPEHLVEKYRRKAQRLGLESARLMFTTETPEECIQVLERYQGKGRYRPGEFTRGLYYRDVE